ncbi:unnamed protein product, partial [Heterotrigona itama]
LLLGTLKTYQRAACDEESMTLKCPVGTTISVVLAQYGRAGSNGTDRCSSSDPSVYIGDRLTNLTCIWPQSLQTHSETAYSLKGVPSLNVFPSGIISVWRGSIVDLKTGNGKFPWLASYED